jgi:osmotically-inducible protein OsmY
MISISASTEDAKDVAQRAFDYLSEEQALRTTTSDILIEAEAGVLALKGRVRTNNLRGMAHRLAKAASDGWQLRDELVSDEDLALEIASRVAMDPRTARTDVRCEVYLGSANLKGVVHSTAQRDAALELARSVPGVESVSSLLTVLD